jgi:hypothetical protein
LAAVHAANELTSEFSQRPTTIPREMDHAYLAALGVTGEVDNWRADAARVLRPAAA